MNPVKKIAIFANTSWNIYNFRLNLIKSIVINNFEVVLIVPDDKYIQKIIEEKISCKIICLSHLQKESINPWNDIKLVFEIRKVLMKEKVDLVLTYTIKPNIYTNFATVYTDIKTINTVTGLGYTFLKKNLTSYVVKLLYKISFLRSNTIVFQNSDDRDLFVAKNLVKKEKTEIVYGSGINTELIQPLKNDHIFPVIKFLFIGRILKHKGIVELIEASKLVIEKNPKLVINIIGCMDSNPSSVSVNELQNMIGGNPNIKYHGHKENVIEWLYNSDVIVLPSYREGLPKVIIEALSVGKPVIVTDTAGCRETVIDGKNGYLVEVKSIESLVKAMDKISNLSQDSLIKMGKASRQLAVEKFDDKIVIGSYLNLIKRI